MRVCALLMLVALVAGAPQEESLDEAPAAEEAPAAAPVEAPTAVVVKTEECGRCPFVSTQHYEAKGCTPVMVPETDPCCPAYYECVSEEARNISLTSCLYGGKTYEVGQHIPSVKGPCRRGCQCKKSLDPEEPAKIECAIVECPSAFSAPRPGCRPIYSNDECCEVDLECSEIISVEEVETNENVTIRESDCFAEGFEYFIGDKIEFSRAPCQQCICSAEFSGAFGPGCIDIDCGLEYRDRLYLRDGCTPLYENSTCCPSDWVCPEDPKLIYDDSKLITGTVDATENCSIGNYTAARGEALQTYDCHMSCQCITPPDFTCVQYTSCPLKVAAQNNREAP